MTHYVNDSPAFYIFIELSIGHRTLRWILFLCSIKTAENVPFFLAFKRAVRIYPPFRKHVLSPFCLYLSFSLCCKTSAVVPMFSSGSAHTCNRNPARSCFQTWAQPRAGLAAALHRSICAPEALIYAWLVDSHKCIQKNKTTRGKKESTTKGAEDISCFLCDVDLLHRVRRLDEQPVMFGCNMMPSCILSVVHT